MLLIWLFMGIAIALVRMLDLDQQQRTETP